MVEGAIDATFVGTAGYAPAELKPLCVLGALAGPVGSEYKLDGV